MATDLEGWLEAVASGRASMSQRGVRWVEAQGGLNIVVAAAKARGVHLVRLTDDAGKVLIAASLHPRNGGYAAAGRCRLVGARLMSVRGAEVLKSLGTRADKARGFQRVCDHAPDMLIASTSPRSRRARRSSLPDDFIARLLIGPFASRPRLVGAMLASALCGLMLAVLPTLPAASSRVILSWDAGCLWFVVASLLAMSGKDGSDIRARSAEQDDGRGKILGVVLLATAASLAASGVELSLAKSDHGDWKTLRVCLAFLTVTAWRRK